jgi:hypothetical protein
MVQNVPYEYIGIRQKQQRHVSMQPCPPSPPPPPPSPPLMYCLSILGLASVYVYYTLQQKIHPRSSCAGTGCFAFASRAPTVVQAPHYFLQAAYGTSLFSLGLE